MKIRLQGQNWRPSELGFLLIALAVHAALLLLPLKSWQVNTTTLPDSISVELSTVLEPARTEDPATPPAEQKAEILDLPPPSAQQAEPERIPGQLVQQELIEPDEAAILEPESNPPSASLLRQSLEYPDWLAKPQEDTRQLGDRPTYLVPDNWKENAGAPYLAEFENTFNGMTVPNQVEIVDRWLAADGSHRVVVNLPNGMTICGRAEAYNPMQPLVEPIMLFVSCGGGGKRSFSVPEHYKRDR